MEVDAQDRMGNSGALGQGREEAEFAGADGCLGSVGDLELGDYVLNVDPDGPRTDREISGDLAVRLSLRHESENFDFARREPPGGRCHRRPGCTALPNRRAYRHVREMHLGLLLVFPARGVYLYVHETHVLVFSSRLPGVLPVVHAYIPVSHAPILSCPASLTEPATTPRTVPFTVRMSLVCRCLWRCSPPSGTSVVKISGDDGVL